MIVDESSFCNAGYIIHENLSDPKFNGFYRCKISTYIIQSQLLSVCPLLRKLKWKVESKFVFAKMFVSLFLWC